MTLELPLWDFAEIAACEPARATALVSAPSAGSLAASVLARFEEALHAGPVRIGMDEAGATPGDLRVTLQFHVGATLSDQFFNATTGYRAQFRQNWRRGLAYNRSLIIQIQSAVAVLAPATFVARRLTHEFEDCGSMEVTREHVCASLDPALSKVWFCAKLIAGNGAVRQLPSGVVGPRLRLADQSKWAAITRDEQDAWLDVKGAFLGASGRYQLTDPVERAKKLAASGEA